MIEGLTKKELVEKERAINEEFISLEKAEKEFSQAVHIALAGKFQCKLDMIRVRNNQIQIKALIDMCHEVRSTVVLSGRDG